MTLTDTAIKATLDRLLTRLHQPNGKKPAILTQKLHLPRFTIFLCLSC
jgi:hypothetical protein